MKTIRKSVFETNSSSTHSITIGYGNNWDTLSSDEDGCIFIFGGEFGWEEASYNDAYTKASYCATAAQYDENRQEMLIKVISSYTNCKVDITFDVGYIDHQSSEVADEVFYSYDDLKQFIFNKDSVLVTDNDNH